MYVVVLFSVDLWFWPVRRRLPILLSYDTNSLASVVVTITLSARDVQVGSGFPQSF